MLRKPWLIGFAAVGIGLVACLLVVGRSQRPPRPLFHDFYKAGEMELRATWHLATGVDDLHGNVVFIDAHINMVAVCVGASQGDGPSVLGIVRADPNEAVVELRRAIPPRTVRLTAAPDAVVIVLPDDSVLHAALPPGQAARVDRRKWPAGILRCLATDQELPETVRAFATDALRKIEPTNGKEGEQSGGGRGTEAQMGGT